MNRDSKIEKALSTRLAKMDDLDAIQALDSTDAYHRESIKSAITSEQCYVASEGDTILGFMLFNYHFYQNGFIELLFIQESSRGAGIGSSLVDYAAQICETEKLFTSTNQSNIPMQILLQSNGFEATGIIHNLDEDDPEIIYFKQLK